MYANRQLFLKLGLDVAKYFFVSTIFLCGLRDSIGQDFEQARNLLFSGDYQKAEQMAQDGLNSASRSQEEKWAELIVEIQLEMGNTKKAAENAELWARWERWGLRKRWLAYKTAKMVGDLNTQQRMLSEMNQVARRLGNRLSDPDDQVVLGEMALQLNADAKLVMKNFFDPVAKKSPDTRSVYLAAGRLALDKGDFGLASKWYQNGFTKFPKDPAMTHGLAVAFSESDSAKTLEWIEKSMSLNQKHVPSRLLLVDFMLNSESYEEALELLDEIEKIQSQNSKMWAYRAAIHHLQNRPDEEVLARQKAFEKNKIDPEIPHLIGKKLSQHYRFKEGSAYQRMALSMNDNYLPSKIQLAQDLLRLGKNEEGWRLANQVHEQDGYDVAAFNLVNLHDNLVDYEVITNDNFIVYVDAAEKDIIGMQALDLLNRAYEKLTKKYGFFPSEPTRVEIFSSTTDFEVRTFGMPNIPGYLGVCFGPVITANSPSTQRMESVNWKAVLWHEFCHTVTLGATRNKMPRWLSEGLSVYEEYQENPAWGMKLTPQFLQWIDDGDLLPISDLSAGFMQPKTPGHIEFAYYQSSMVVEYLLTNFDESKMADLLKDLSRGLEINNALEKSYTSLSKLETEFSIWINEKVKKAAGKLDFSKPALVNFGAPPRPGDGDFDLGAFKEKIKNNNFWMLMDKAEKLFDAGDLEGAQEISLNILDEFNQPRQFPNPLSILTKIYNAQEKPEDEKKVLEKWVGLEVAPPSMYRRLVQLAKNEKDNQAIFRYSNELLAIDPFEGQVYEDLAVVSTEENNKPEAISYWEAALQLNPINPAEIHYQIFLLTKDAEPEKAYKHLLSTLELAPRHRDALKSFLTISNKAEKELKANSG